MLKIILYSALLFSLSSAVFADENTHMLTNEDLKKYKRESDNSPSQVEDGIQQVEEIKTSGTEQASSNQAAYDSWCDAGTTYRNSVETAKRDVEEAEMKLLKERPGVYRTHNGKLIKSYSLSVAENNLENAKKRLKDAEFNLSDLESRAHRKGIKPGWLRCQK